MQNRRNQEGFALVLVIIFTVLLVAIVTELITTAKMARLTGENDALLSRMRMHMSYVLSQVEDTLKDDLSAGKAQAGAPGGSPAAGGLPIPGGAGAGSAPGGGQPQGNVDSSQDSWFEPTSYSEGDLTTYTWIEDENRKFNILALASPDQEFARESKERFVRLIDALREETDFDLGSSDGERLARVIIEWLQGNNRSESLPKAPLKSDLEERRQMTVPLQLEELLLLPGIDEDLYYDKVIDQKIALGLESVLTVYTSLTFDPGDPNKQPAPTKSATSGQPSDPQVGQSGRTPQQPQGGQGQPKSPATGPGGKAEPVQPTGLGVRININTATRPVLRCLFTTAEISDAVIEAILRDRNEEAPPEDENAAGGAGAAQGQPSPTPARTSYSSGSSSGEIAEGEKKKRKIFSTIEDLEKIPEYQNLATAGVKTKLAELVTTQSDVFTIHMASLFKRNEKTKSFVIRRARSIEVRIEDGDSAVLHPLMLLEDRKGLRIMPIDFPRDEAALRQQQSEMDAYSSEERAWNPFYVDFYKPKSDGN